jgi:hypothetical protein
MRYSPERKEAVLQKMMPPHNRSIKQQAQCPGLTNSSKISNRERVSEADGGLIVPD